jgi:hypothetical protein
MQSISRHYGSSHSLGDILFNSSTNEIFSTFDLGFFGRVTIFFSKRSTGGFDIFKKHNNKIINLGRSFPIKNKLGFFVPGLTKGSLSLSPSFDNKNSLFFTTHMLKHKKNISNGVFKIGFIDGCFGIES